jgi:LmbE family N-acetylglucosaminyl deacetylase
VEASRPPAALVLSPHPDDELLGCPAHLFALRDAGWRVLDVALSLGGAGHEHRRREELELASARAGFELCLAPPGLLATDSPAPPAAAVEYVLELARSVGARLLVAPSPHDDHPAHERTGRLAVASARAGATPRLWLWGLWADLALPNSLCVFDEERLAEIGHALDAHAGELARNDYRRLLRSRAEAAAILLPERVFGYGSAGLAAGGLAEGVCDVTVGTGGELALTAPARFDAASLLAGTVATTGSLDRWLESPSARMQAGLG